MSFAQTPLLPGVSRRGVLDQRRWLQRAAAISVLLHLLLAAFLLYRAPPRAPEAPAESLPSVELVFDEAAPRAAPTPGAPPLPAPVLSLAEPPAPPPAPEPPRPPAPASSPPPSPAPSAATAPPAPPAPPPVPPAPNTAAAPPRPPAPPAVVAPTPREAPPVLAAPLPLPGPPPPAAPPDPQPRIAAPAPPRPAAPPAPQAAPPEAPRPVARPQPRPAEPAASALAGTRFIPDATLGPLRPPQSAPATRRTAPEQLALGPNARPDQPNAAPAARADDNVAGATMRITGASLGADWRAAFMEWLRRNGRFPREAAMNGEDGTNVVRFEVDRQGRVQSVRLTTRSGSQWLDINSTALLRDRTIPPFPPGTESNSATIDLTINYVLVRR